MLKLHILEIGTGLEAHALRAASEYWGASVTVTWVGNSRQIVDYLAGGPEHEVIFICGHGDERELVLPTLAPNLRDHYPYHEVIRPDDFRTFLRLNGNTVVNTSCRGGMSQLAEAFLASGAGYYIGSTGDPAGSASLMYSLAFLYNYIQTSGQVEEAHQQAASYPDDRKQFTLYQAARNRQ